VLQVFLEDAALALEGRGGRVGAGSGVVMRGGALARGRGLSRRRLALGRRPRRGGRRGVVPARVLRRRLALGRGRRRGGRGGVLHPCAGRGVRRTPRTAGEEGGEGLRPSLPGRGRRSWISESKGGTEPLQPAPSGSSTGAWDLTFFFNLAWDLT